MLKLPRHRVRRLSRCDGARRRLEQRRGPRPCAAGRGHLLPRAGEKACVHHRRGAHALHRGVQRAAENSGGAAGAPDVHSGDDRAAQGARDHSLALPALCVPAHSAARDRGTAELHRGAGGHRPPAGRRGAARAHCRRRAARRAESFGPVRGGGRDHRQRGGARRAGTGGQPPDRAADGLRSAARHKGRAAAAPPALRQRQGRGRGARRAVRARARPAHFRNGSRGRRGAAHGRLRRPDDGQPFAAGRQRAAYRHLHHAPARGGGHERERQPPHGCGAVSPEALRRNALRRPERHQRSPRAA